MGTPANAAAAAKARERAVDVLDRDVQMQLAASLVYAHTSATTMAQHNFPSVSRVGAITLFLRTIQLEEWVALNGLKPAEEECFLRFLSGNLCRHSQLSIFGL